jgi:hypothetical protein
MIGKYSNLYSQQRDGKKTMNCWYELNEQKDAIDTTSTQECINNELRHSWRHNVKVEAGTINDGSLESGGRFYYALFGGSIRKPNKKEGSQLTVNPLFYGGGSDETRTRDLRRERHQNPSENTSIFQYLAFKSKTYYEILSGNL